MVQDVASSRSEDMNWNQQIVIGSPIGWRVTEGRSTPFYGWIQGIGKDKDGVGGRNIINEVRNPVRIGTGSLYDTVIVTENHQILDHMEYWSTIPYVRMISDFYSATNPTRVFFYHSWLDFPSGNFPVWLAYEASSQRVWECAAAKVNNSFVSEGRSNRILNLPIGGALNELSQRILNNEVPTITGTDSQKMARFFVDTVHNTALGQYYISLLTYSAVFGKKPTGVNPSGKSNIGFGGVTVPQTLVTYLIDSAWEYISNYYQTGQGNWSMSQCRGFRSDFCTKFRALASARGASNIVSQNSCENILNNQFSDTNFTKIAPP